MSSAQRTHLAAGSDRSPSGMRVVIMEPDASIRETLQRIMDGQAGFLLMGESQSWAECESLLDLFVPELLITRLNPATSDVTANFADDVFPVVVGVRSPDCRKAQYCTFETLDVPLDAKSISMTIERVRTEIYRRKLDELSVLLQRYVNCSRGLQQYLSSVRVESSGDRDIPAEQVLFIAADRNYVRVHAGANVHEIRDTMSSMTSRLDPSQFVRVHRSFIVNRSHVQCIVRKDGAAMGVLLSNGLEIPIGPNYRADIDSVGSLGSRLSA